MRDFWEFPNGLVVRVWCFHCYGLGSISGQGLRSHKSCGRDKKKKKRIYYSNETWKNEKIMKQNER